MNQSMPKLTDKPLAKAQPPAQSFDQDVHTVMERRDDKLIADNIRYGVSSNIFVYQFPMDGKQVAGITIDGAEHLARHYGGLKHRIIASCHKFGEIFKYQSYAPFDVKATIIQELVEQPDYYEVLVEIVDSHTQNSRQITKQEYRMEKRRNSNDMFERKHYTTIAESKAYRNAVLSLVPKDVQEEFKKECIKLGQSEDIKGSVIDEKRDGCIRFAAKHSIGVNRQGLEGLSWEQLCGLSDAAQEDGIYQFQNSLNALGLLEGEMQAVPKDPPKKKSSKKAAPTATLEQPPVDTQAPLEETPPPATANNGDAQQTVKFG